MRIFTNGESTNFEKGESGYMALDLHDVESIDVQARRFFGSKPVSLETPYPRSEFWTNKIMIKTGDGRRVTFTMYSDTPVSVGEDAKPHDMELQDGGYWEEKYANDRNL